MGRSMKVCALALAGWLSAVYGHAAPGSYVGSSQNFSLTQTTTVPGGTLKAGEYSIRVLDQLSDRMLVRIDKTDEKEHLLFLGVPHAAFADASGAGPQDWKAGVEGTQALRGFAFSSGSTVEFVYPKAQAAALATKNAETVVAIDPESEGRPQLTKMSHDDMQEVTLWMLTLTTASPNSKTPALLAQKYAPAASAGNVQMARAASPSSSRAVPVQQQIASVKQPLAPSAQATRSHAIRQLPHTASDLPLIWLAGLISLFAAAGLRLSALAFGNLR